MRYMLILAHLALGTAYTGYGVITAIEMKRNWRTAGFSHFGAAWILMAFTCGPHHLDHALHLTITQPRGGPLDLAAVLIGLPFGVIWLGLRVEALRGGRGDRFISGTPSWLVASPTLTAAYVTAVIAASLRITSGGMTFTGVMTPNIALFFLYMSIGYFLFRTQIRNRPAMGGWSVSGLSLGFVFPTCAIMHAVYLLYAGAGVYAQDIHGLTIDWLGVPAAGYFLWVVHGLYKNALRDWNRTMGGQPLARVG